MPSRFGMPWQSAFCRYASVLVVLLPRLTARQLSFWLGWYSSARRSGSWIDWCLSRSRGSAPDFGFGGMRGSPCFGRRSLARRPHIPI